MWRTTCPGFYIKGSAPVDDLVHTGKTFKSLEHPSHNNVAEVQLGTWVGGMQMFASVKNARLKVRAYTDDIDVLMIYTYPHIRTKSVKYLINSIVDSLFQKLEYIFEWFEGRRDYKDTYEKSHKDVHKLVNDWLKKTDRFEDEDHVILDKIKSIGTNIDEKKDFNDVIQWIQSRKIDLEHDKELMKTASSKMQTKFMKTNLNNGKVRPDTVVQFIENYVSRYNFITNYPKLAVLVELKHAGGGGGRSGGGGVGWGHGAGNW
jgi:hypothetical protein